MTDEVLNPTEPILARPTSDSLDLDLMIANVTSVFQYVDDPEDVTRTRRSRDGHDDEHAVRERMAHLRAMRTDMSGLRLGDVIGQGGMGLVREAEQQSVGRTVVVKTPRDARPAPDVVSQMVREAWVTGTLEHPNVIPIYDVKLDEADTPHIVMRRISGRSWETLIDKPEELVDLGGASDHLEFHLRVLIQVCRALEYAHGLGILHRDIKPENVIVGELGEVYLIDWGIAIALTPDPRGLLPVATANTAMAGTPAYIAPEMLTQNPDDLGIHSDIYLLGATLYHVVCGDPPHDGDTPMEACLSSLESRITLPDTVDPELKGTVLRAMALFPEARYPSVAAFRGALEQWLRRRSSRQLVSHAREQLATLRTLAVETEPADPAAHQARLYRSLGACRFGYEQSLTIWPDNETAVAELDEALCLVATFEARRGHRHSASALLTSVREVPAELTALIEALRSDELAQEARLYELETQNDRDSGWVERRRYLLITIALVGIVIPALDWLHHALWGPATHLSNTIRTMAQFGIAGLMISLAGRRLADTLLNLQTAHSLAIAGGTLILAALAFPALPLDALMAQSVFLLLIGGLIAIVSPSLDVNMVPGGGALLVAGVISAWFPLLLFPGILLANTILLLNVARVWKSTN